MALRRRKKVILLSNNVINSAFPPPPLFPSTYIRDLRQQDVVAGSDDVAGKFAKDYRTLRSWYTLLLTMSAVVEADASELVHARDRRQEIHVGLGRNAPSLGNYSVTNRS